jgi:sugar phosphate permease
VLSPALKEQFDIGVGALGVGLAATTGGMTLTLLAWGLLTDRIGERAVISTGLGVAAVLLALAGAADDYALLVALVTVAGMAGAAVNAATGRAVMSWFPATERGLALGIRQTAVPVGSGLGALVLPALDARFGLGAAFLALGIGCAVAAVGAFVWLRDAPGFPEEAIGDDVASPLRDRRLWQLAAGSTLLVSVQIALTGFLVLYLHEERGLSPGAAGAVLAAISVLGAVLRIGLGRFSDRVGSRLRPLRRLSLALGAAMATAALLTEAPDWVLVSALLVAGALSVGWNGLSFTATAELAGRERSGAALGFQQTALGLGAVVAPIGFAAVVGATSWPVGFGVLALLPLGAFATFGPLLAAERVPSVRRAR